ncbi:tyrosine-protein phosphatase 10D isoform X2 [Bacillus rossius redtenbacheri]|uniref:tyrosine-protein phosphatase 10D isoform X2 n=1 Tax=Bacillus rossius redtenbacheri TaxID=93214 RepID=UPI002FDD7BC2
MKINFDYKHLLPFRISWTTGCWLFLLSQLCGGEDIVIKIPRNGNLSQEGSLYRLDYTPRRGHPAPNTTFDARDISDERIQFSQGLPGTRYQFWLYYSNSSLSSWLLTWTAAITTAPDPPSNLSVTVRSGKTAQVSWSPPALGSYSNFSLKVLSLLEPNANATVVSLDRNTFHYVLQNLTPGAPYQVQLFTVYDSKESVAYISRNFTTKPNTPGKFIVWFRNETTLLVLWQPPYPTGVYSLYKVSIDPPDALESALFVEKEGEPPGPAQAAFKGLVPGRAYNISVQTVSEDEVSAPTTAQYRTVPLRPRNVTFDKQSITPHSVLARWEPPDGTSEFDKYQLLLSTRRATPVTLNREEPTVYEFKDNLEPGRTYQLVVKTVSGKVGSWPATGNVTLKPLPVYDLRAKTNENTGMITISWKPNVTSLQDSYKIFYHEVQTSSDDNGDSNVIFVHETHKTLELLLPGRNYSISVQAVSNGMEGGETTIYQALRPLSPIIQDVKQLVRGLNITWRSDVQSRQEKFKVVYNRNDTANESADVFTKESYLEVQNLFPGAGYDVKVFAISHDLLSEPHFASQVVYPNPPRNLTIEKTTSISVLVKWETPLQSLLTEYSIRYRTEEDPVWMKLPSVKGQEAEVTDLTPGERYLIQVNTVSYGTESARPQQVNQTIRPNPVSNIVPLVDSTNVTLEWPRPEGRIERYTVRWVLEGRDDSPQEKSVPEANASGAGAEGQPVRLLIGDLMPGVKYLLEMHASSYGLDSDVTSLAARTRPLIQSDVTIVTSQQETGTLTLRYTRTPQTSSRFDTYRFSLSDPGVPVLERPAGDPDRKVTFAGLVPGRLYNITVWTVSEGVPSQPLQRQERLYPEPISGINATHITDTEITLRWDRPKGEVTAFEVQYLNAEGMLIQNLTLHNSMAMGDLKAHRNYTFTVVVRSGTESSILRRSLPVSAVFTTQESVPGKVEKFRPIDIQPSSIIFEWSLPSNEQNGIIQNFRITYGLENSAYTSFEDFRPDEFQGTIKKLIPGRTYVFRIQAQTRIGFGPEATWTQKMPILAPPKPGSHLYPIDVHKTTTTIEIRYGKNFFSQENGEVKMYTIIVAEDDSKNASGLEMPSWRDVQAYSVWPPYQVVDPYHYHPFKNSNSEYFTVGGENCEGRGPGYCNGPLKPGTTYRIKVRAFTAPDKFTDTYYSFPIQTDADNTSLILGTTIPIFLIALLSAIVIMIRMRRNRKNAMDSRINDNLSIPDSIIDTSRPVRLENFAEHYRIMSADSDFRFSEEFEELKHVGRDQPCTAADLPCNRPKNRFTNILPYDHSRVKLQPVDDEEGSDYINANYVPGHNSPREFIVTQGPLHSTRDDFWRMCWESNSRAIVMLTRCIEKGREKCDHYWPYDTQPVYYGDICVTLLNESHYPDWCIAEFMMCRGDVSRVMRHFHFTTWPDFGVPSPPQTLVRFVRAFRERVGPEQRPIVVHCSAGVGRSGTFIALDRILQQINVSDHVDIFGIVHGMRKERVWMVQTEQQYICIHQCLLAVLEGNENQGAQREIHDNQGFEDDEGIAESGL